MGKHEELREIIADMRAHGFTQLRRTTHGWLYGFQSFRILVPHVLKDDHRAASVALVHQEWTKLKGQVRGENPGLAALVAARRGDGRGLTETVSVDEIEPVVNIEDIVAAGAPPVPLIGALEPTPPHQMEVPNMNPFAEGREAHVRPPTLPEESTTMPHPFKCEKCGRIFGRPSALGRHRVATHGLEHQDKRRQHETRPSRSKTKQKPTHEAFVKASQAIVVKPVNFVETILKFEAAAFEMIEAYKALNTERDHYKFERDALAGRLTKFEALKDMFK